MKLFQDQDKESTVYIWLIGCEFCLFCFPAENDIKEQENNLQESKKK